MAFTLPVAGVPACLLVQTRFELGSAAHHGSAAGLQPHQHVVAPSGGRENHGKHPEVVMVDMAHFVGLVAGQVLTGDFDPVPHAHIVTHDHAQATLRGPRGGMVLCGRDLAEVVDRGCPLVLGGPLRT